MKSAIARSQPATPAAVPAPGVIRRRPAPPAAVEEVQPTGPAHRLVCGVAIGLGNGSRMIARQPEPAREQPLALACGGSSHRRGGR